MVTQGSEILFNFLTTFCFYLINICSVEYSIGFFLFYFFFRLLFQIVFSFFFFEKKSDKKEMSFVREKNMALVFHF